jgi:hypothetical protein
MTNSFLHHLIKRSVLLIIVLAVFAFTDRILKYPDDSRRERIKKALVKGCTFLVNAQQANGAIADSVNPLFQVWETVLATSALYDIEKDTNNPGINKALLYLKKNENAGGLICHNIKCRDRYCLETTAAYFSLLLATGQKEKVIKRLQAVKDMQLNTGEWNIGNPDVREEKNFPSVTAFVLNIFTDVQVLPLRQKEAIRWLIEKQKTEGHWGAAWEYYGCKAYALWPVMKTLANDTTALGYDARIKASLYCYASQNKDGSWFYDDQILTRQTSPQLQTALILAALRYASPANKEVVRKGIDFLLDHQSSNGSWDGGYFPVPAKQYVKQEYIFATALAISTLNWYLHNSDNL